MDLQAKLVSLHSNLPNATEPIIGECLTSWRAGHCSYIEINAPKNPAAFPGEPKEYVGKPLYFTERNDFHTVPTLLFKNPEAYPSIREGQTINAIADISLDDDSFQYFFFDGELIFLRRGPIKNVESYVQKFDKLQKEERNRHLQPIYPNNTFPSSNEYLNSLGEDLEHYCHEFAAADADADKFGAADADNQRRAHNKAQMICTAFHLYGFGEEATRRQDVATARNVFALAGIAYPVQLYEQAMCKRLCRQQHQPFLHAR